MYLSLNDNVTQNMIIVYNAIFSQLFCNFA